MTLSSERLRENSVLLELIEPTKAVVEAAREILGPEQDGFQKVTLQLPDRTHLEIFRYVDIDDDIYTAGHRDPFEDGLLISCEKDKERRDFFLPRRPEAVSLQTIFHLEGASVKELESLARKLREGEVVV